MTAGISAQHTPEGATSRRRPLGALVALLDDDPVSRRTLSRQVRRAGCEIVRSPRLAAQRHELLLASVLRAHPDVAVVDVDSTGEGAQLIELLARARLPVVALTRSSEQATHGECVLRGAGAVMVKPVDPDQLVEVLRVMADGGPALTSEERDTLVRAYHARRAAWHGEH